MTEFAKYYLCRIYMTNMYSNRNSTKVLPESRWLITPKDL